MKINTTTLLIALLALGLLAGGYYYFSSGSGGTTPLSASAPGSVAEEQFIALVSQLGSVSFDTSIFSDPRFIALVDLATPLAPEASGRTDPFAPIGGGK